MRIRAFGLLLMVIGGGSAWAQPQLTLDEALLMARTANGTVRSAFYDYEAARASARAQKSSFFPRLTPSFTKQVGRSENLTGPFRGSFYDDREGAQIDLDWQLLDSGERTDALRRAELSAAVTELEALQTVRQTLFDVHSRFFDALRTQALLRVQIENLNRAQVILEQTRVRANPPVEDVPRKNILQAEADYQNARVNVLTAENRVAAAEANLKEILGIDAGELPELVEPEDQTLPPLDLTLQQAIDRGLRRRADLVSFTYRLESQRVAIRSARREGELQFSLDANLRKIFAEDPYQRAALVFSASLPVFDGERAKSLTESARLTLESLEATYVQNRRVVKAEIESAYKEYGQNRLRQDAAAAALLAARENYNAAVEAQKEGAGNLLEVLTAQVSLTTAESNLVEATYDLLISNVRLSLAIGDPVPGEELP